MIELAYSKKLIKRIIFVSICVLMSFLLSITMFRAEAIAVVRDHIQFVDSANHESDISSDNIEDTDKEQQVEKVDNAEINTDNSSEEADTVKNNEKGLDVQDQNYEVKDQDSDNNKDKEEAQKILGDINAETNQIRINLADNKDTSINKTAGEDTELNNSLSSLDVNNEADSLNSSNNILKESNSIESSPYVNWTRTNVSDGPNEYWWDTQKNEEQKAKENIDKYEDGSAEHPFTVATADTFLNLLQGKKEKDDAPKKTQHIKLVDDIDLTNASKANTEGEEWKLLPYSNFSGVLDGDGHKIFCSNNVRTPLFSNLSSATIKNLTLELSVRWTDEKDNEVTMSDKLGNNLGVLCCSAGDGVNISDCSFCGCVANRSDDVGYSTKHIGGIIGILNGATSKGISFNNVVSKVKVNANGTAVHHAGGFIGSVNGINNIVNISNCENIGNVETVSGTSAWANIAIQVSIMIAQFIGKIVFSALLSYGIRSIRNPYSLKDHYKGIKGVETEVELNPNNADDMKELEKFANDCLDTKNAIIDENNKGSIFENNNNHSPVYSEKVMDEKFVKEFNKGLEENLENYKTTIDNIDMTTNKAVNELFREDEFISGVGTRVQYKNILMTNAWRNANVKTHNILLQSVKNLAEHFHLQLVESNVRDVGELGNPSIISSTVKLTFESPEFFAVKWWSSADLLPIFASSIPFTGGLASIIMNNTSNALNENIFDNIFGTSAYNVGKSDGLSELKNIRDCEIQSPVKSFECLDNVYGFFDVNNILLLNNNQMAAAMLLKPITNIVKKISNNGKYDDNSQQIGRYKINSEVDDIIKDAVIEIKNNVSNSSTAESELGSELYNDILSCDTDGTDNILFSLIKQLSGDLFTKRFNYNFGNRQLLWNIFNQNVELSENNEDSLENTNDFVAMQGKLISEGKNPVANLLPDSDLNSFRNRSDISAKIRAASDLSRSRQDIENFYYEIGFEYCKQVAMFDNVPVTNQAYDVDSITAANTQRILKQASLNSYYKLRNQTETWSENGKDGSYKTVKAALILRKLMNGEYTDQLLWLDFLTEWGDLLYSEFEKLMLSDGVWSNNFEFADDDAKKTYIKHYFNTYITYSGEFSYDNYLPMLRAALMIDNAGLYATDFLLTNSQIKEYGFSGYSPSNENWRYTNKYMGIEKPVEFCILQECNIFKSEEVIEKFFNCDFDSDLLKLDSMLDGNYSNNDSEQDNSNMLNSDSIADTGQFGIYSTFAQITSLLQQCASSLPPSPVANLQMHYNAYAGGFIGYGENLNISINNSSNSGQVTGGDDAGGFIGYVNGESKINIEFSSNSGTVSCTNLQELHPFVGGFIGEVSSSLSKVNIISCTGSGTMVSRYAVGGLVGDIRGYCNVKNTACVAGLAAPKYCGGFFAMADNAKDVNVDSSYTASAYDTASNNTKVIWQLNFALNFIGLQAPTWTTGNTNNKTYVNKAGALAGVVSSNHFSVNNFYYKEGVELIGNDYKLDDLSEKNSFEVVSLDEFLNGSVAYKLNAMSHGTTFAQYNPDDDANPAFSQIIDDFNYGSKQNFPIPYEKGAPIIYKDNLSVNTIYTNYNTRFIQTHNVEFSYNNCTVNPDTIFLRVKHGDDFYFGVTVNDGYTIENVYSVKQNYSYNNTNQEEVALPQTKNNRNKYFEYALNDVRDDVIIKIKTTKETLNKPSGSGTDYNPYLIYTANELAWLNNMMIEQKDVSCHIKLMNDINFAGYIWKPVGSLEQGAGFSGSFDGNNHKITNITIDPESGESGAFFNGVEGSSNYNVILGRNEIDSDIDKLLAESDTKIAVPAQSLDLILYLYNRFRQYNINEKIVRVEEDDINKAIDECIDKVNNFNSGVSLCCIPKKDVAYTHLKILDTCGKHGYISNLTLSGQFRDAVFANSARDATFENCVGQGIVTGSGQSCGGIVAFATKNIKLDHCTNEAIIQYNAPGRYHCAVGGMVGSLTSEKYIYSEWTTKEEYYKGNYSYNRLDARITNCINKAYISGSSSYDQNVEVGGIVGNISEVNYNYNIDEDFSKFNEKDYKDKAIELNDAYVLIDSCQNFGNIGDTNNSYKCVAAGIVCSIGYLRCTNPYRCDINNCINYGNIGYDAAGHETSIQGAGGIVYYSNNNAGGKNNNDYIVDLKKCSPITDHSSLIGEKGKNKIINSINYGDVRQRGDCKYAGQLCAYSGIEGIIFANCLMCGWGTDAISNVSKSAYTKVEAYHIYGNNTNKLNESFRKNSRTEDLLTYNDDELKTGKIAYEMAEYDKDFYTPFVSDSTKTKYQAKIGQNIDNIIQNKYELQTKPSLLDENTQKVYKKDILNKFYSPYGAVSDAYTNNYNSSWNLDSSNSYKINISVCDDEEREINDVKSVGLIDGFVVFEHDEHGSGKTSLDIKGTNGYVLSKLSFGSVEIKDRLSNKYNFNITKSGDEYFMDKNKLEYHRDNGGFITFDLKLNFSNISRPKFVDDSYQISNSFELKWFALNYNNAEECSKDKKNDLNIWNATITNDIYIPNDDYIIPIGDDFTDTYDINNSSSSKYLDNKFHGTFSGCLNGSDKIHTIYNYSTKPIFGALGCSANVKNLNIVNECVTDNSWSAAAAKFANGDVTFNNVTINGYVSGTNKDEANSKDSTAAGFISSSLNGFISFENCHNNMNIERSVAFAGGFIGNSITCKLLITNCTNSGNITNNNSCSDNIKCCSAGCIANIVNNYYQKQNGFFYGSWIIKNFTNNGTISLTSRNPVSQSIDSNNTGAAGIIGSFEDNSIDDAKHEFNISFSRNNGKVISDSNCGGLIAYFNNKNQSTDKSDCTLNISACENDAELCLNKACLNNNSMGGLVGVIDNRINSVFYKSLAATTFYDFSQKSENVAGMIGISKSASPLKISWCSSYVKDFKESKFSNISGVIAKIDKLESLEYEHLYWGHNIFLNDNEDSAFPASRKIGKERWEHENIIQSNDNPESGLIQNFDYASGYVAYLLNEEGCNINNNTITIGQMIDYDKNHRESYPHFNSRTVYYVNYVDMTQEHLCSNFDNQALKDKLFINYTGTYSYAIPNEINTQKKNFCHSTFLINEDSDNWLLNIKPDDDKFVLTEIKINDFVIKNNANKVENVTVEDKEKSTNSSDNIDLYDLKYNVPDGFENPFVDSDTIDLKKLNKIYASKYKKNLFAAGYYNIECIFSDFYEPQIIDYTFHTTNDYTFNNSSDKKLVEEAYAIRNAQELSWFAKYKSSKNSLMNSYNIVLKDNIDMSGFEGVYFSGYCNGRFFGEGHKIYNISNKNNKSGKVTELNAFIGTAKNAEFRDLEINVNFFGSNVHSAFINNASSVLIDNVTVSGSVNIDTAGNFGGVVYCASGNYSYTNSSVSTFAGKDYVNTGNKIENIITDKSEPEIMSHWSGSRIYNCRNNMTNIHFNKFGSSQLYVGGIVGYTTQDSYLAISNCNNSANLTFTTNCETEYSVAGIIGFGNPCHTHLSIYDCTNLGNIFGYYAGGIIGCFGSWTDDEDINGEMAHNKGNLDIKGCVNLGDVKGVVCAGIISAILYVGYDDGLYDNYAPKDPSLIHIDCCMNRGYIYCNNYDEDTLWHDNMMINVAGGILGTINDGLGKRHTSTYINHCGNLGVVDVHGERPSGGIVGFEDEAYQNYVLNSYSLDTVYGDDSDKVHGIVGVADNGALYTFNIDGCLGLQNVYVVSNSNSLGVADEDGYIKKSKSMLEENERSIIVDNFSYSRLVNGELAFELNQNDYLKFNSAQDVPDGKDDVKYEHRAGAWGQKIDNINAENCSRWYPQPNKADVCPIHLTNKDWKNKTENGFVAYNENSPVSTSLYRGSYNTLNKKLLSNYKDSQVGVQINVWDKTFENGVFVDKIHQGQYHGSVQIMEPDGSVPNILGPNNACNVALSCNYTGYLSLYNGGSEDRAYNIVVKPADGCLVSFIAIDSVIRDVSLYNGSNKSDKYGNLYNVIKTSDLSDGKSHTIDVGFTDISAPTYIKSTNTYQISNYPELLWFSNYVNTGHNKVNAEVVSDNIIASFTGTNGGFVPIGTNNFPFKGTFDGMHHKITGVSYKNDGHSGFFKYASGATIKNLVLSDVSFESTGEKDSIDDNEQATGALIANADNINVDNVEVYGQVVSIGLKMGGLIGYISGGKNTISNCTNAVSPSQGITKVAHIGGIVGYINCETHTTISSCENFANIKSNWYKYGASDWRTDYGGGIVAYCNSHNFTELTICDCNNWGTILADSAGGILGDFSDDDSGESNYGQKLKIQNCANLGHVCGDYCGGILGRIDDSSVNSDRNCIDWCSNSGRIGSPEYKLRCVGGIVGQINDGHLKIDVNYCSNDQRIYAGGGKLSDDVNEGLPLAMSITGIVSTLFGASSYFIIISSLAKVSVSAGPIGVILMGLLAATASLIITVVQSRTTVICRAGGIIGYIDRKEDVKMSNSINYASVSSNDWYGGITADQEPFDGFNLYTIDCKAWPKNADKNLDAIHTASIGDFQSGKVAYELQNSGMVNRYYSNGNLTKSIVDTNSKSAIQIGKNINGQNMPVYFGQNIDKLNSDLPKSKIPVFCYPTPDFRIFRAPGDIEISGLGDRVFYTNNNDIKELTDGFGKLNIYGDVIDKSNDNKVLNDDLKNEYRNELSSLKDASTKDNADTSFDSSQNLNFASDNVDEQDVDDKSLSSDEESDDDNFDNNKNSKDFSLDNDKEDLSNYIEISVNGSRSDADITPTIEDDYSRSLNSPTEFFKTYNMFNNETITIKLKPKRYNGKFVSINDIKIPIAGQEEQGTKYYKFNGQKLEEVKSLNGEYGFKYVNGETTIFNDDGSYEVQINQKWVYNNESQDGKLIGYDAKYKVFNDGSAIIECPGIDTSKCKYQDIKISLVKENEHKHKVPGLNTEIHFNAWDAEDSLPTKSGAYYLRNDIELDDIYYAPVGVTYLCLNGHKIKLKNNAYFDLTKNHSSLYIVDCKGESNDAMSQIEYDNFDRGLYRFVDTDNADDINVVFGGIIYFDPYSSQNSNGDNFMFKLDDYCKLNVDNINLFQKNDSKSLILLENNIKNYELVLNGKIYEPAKNINNNNLSFVTFNGLDTSNDDISKIKSSKIVYGDNYFHRIMPLKKEFKYADIYIPASSANLNITFSDKYSFDMPISIASDSLTNSTDCINLTTSFDSFVKKGVDYRKAFRYINTNDSLDFALTSLEDVKDHSNIDLLSSDYVNNICICNNEALTSVDIKCSGSGNIYPSGDFDSDTSLCKLLYKFNSQARYYYQTDELSYLEYIKCYKMPFKDINLRKQDVSMQSINVRKDATLLYSDASDLRFNAFGEFYVQNINLIEKDKSVQFNGGTSYYMSKENVSSTMSLDVSFMSSKMAVENVKEWKNWTDSSSLPYNVDTFASVNAYKLMTDVELEGHTWQVPEAKIVLDLNGHSITVKKDSGGVKNENIISLRDKNTSLSIIDSSLSTANPPVRYFHKNKEDQYQKISHDEALSLEDVVEVKGGIIYGANTIRNYYYNYEPYAGAVLVEKGIFNMYSGTIGFNKSTDRRGGAAISVKLDGKAYLYKDASICNNEIYGDYRLGNKDCAAAISSQGYLYNEGKIINNVAYKYSASAVSVTKDGKNATSQFINNGLIQSNICHEDNDDETNHANETFGSVYIGDNTEFVNSGTISNNKSDFEVAAVVADGTLTIQGLSLIYDNMWCSDLQSTDSKNWNKLDINQASGKFINIAGSLELQDKHASYLKPLKENTTVTSGWEKVSSSDKKFYIDDIFKIAGDDDSLVLALAPNNEIMIVNKANVCKLDVKYIYGSEQESYSDFVKCNLNDSDNYILSENYDVSVSLEEGYQLISININDNEVNLVSSQFANFKYNFKRWNDFDADEQGLWIMPVYISYENINPEKLDYLPPSYPSLSTVHDWTSSSSMPLDDGNYRLCTNVKLKETWIPSNNVFLDLNGYSITIDDNIDNINVIYINDKDANIIITDSTLTNDFASKKTHYMHKNNYNYSFSETSYSDDDIVISGGYIGGTRFMNASKSGAVYVEAGNLCFDAGNVVGNSVYNNENQDITTGGHGASAIYVGNDANVLLGNNLSISYNYSQCSTVKRYEYGSAGLEVRGICKSYARISNNECNYNSVAGVAVVSNGSSFINKGDIVHNVANNNSCAGLLVSADNIEYLLSDNVYAKNYGDIKDNVASNNSIAAVELYGKLVNAGKIYNNISTDESSFAGIYSFGNLTLDENSEINRNVYRSNINTDLTKHQDIIFDEADYSDFYYNSDGSKALFTLGEKYNPSVATYVNSKLDAPIPRSLTYVSVRNSDNNSNSSPLLLAKGFVNNSNNRTLQDIFKYFSTVDNDYEVSVTQNGDICYNHISQSATLHINANYGGSVNYLGTFRTIMYNNNYVSFPLEVSAYSGYYIKSISVTSSNDNAPKYIKLTNNYNVSQIINNDCISKSVDIDFEKVEYANVKITDDSQHRISEEKSSSSSKSDKESETWEPWKTYDRLPKQAVGYYKLECDIMLYEPWIVPTGSNLHIDLNGHNIYRSKSFKPKGDYSSMIVLGKNQSLSIKNSMDEEKAKKYSDNFFSVYFKENPDTGLYVYSKYASGNSQYGDQPVFTAKYGGCICSGDAKNGQGGAFYVDESAYLTLDNTILAGNNAEEGGAIYNKAEVFIFNNSYIIGNTATKGAGVFNTSESIFRLGKTLENENTDLVKADFVPDVTIKKNVASWYGGGLYTNGLLMIGNNFWIGQNRIKKTENDSELYVPSDVDFQQFNLDVQGFDSNQRQGAVLSVLSDMYGKADTFMYMKCLSSDPGHEGEQIGMLALTGSGKIDPSNIISKGLYAVDKEGVFLLSSKDVENHIYRRDEIVMNNS